MSFQDWMENPPAFLARYDVANGDWNRFYNRYTAGTQSPPLLRIIEIAVAHGVQSILVETRYIDADWRSEHARFYSTTYKRYPSIAHRAHFFTQPLPGDLSDLSGLVDAYKGYTVFRPIPTQPVGRTMIEPPPELKDAMRCETTESVDVLGWRMVVKGMPFVSQDAQYMRCAHADIWMVLRHAFLRRQLGQRLSSDIHDATMGGVIAGREVPSEGLSSYQMMAGLSTLGLSPAILPLPQSKSASDAAGVLGLFDIVCRYVNSNISPIIVSDNHVWLIVAYARSASAAHPSLTLYRHDDAAGPYIRVEDPWNEPASPHQRWKQVMLPLPPKIYMTAERAEEVGKWWFRTWISSVAPTNPAIEAHNSNNLTFRTYGIDSSEYKFALATRPGFDPVVAAKYRLTPLPRNLWVVEAIDRRLRGAQAEHVLGEVLVDPTASHYTMAHDPGIVAAHAPGFWWITTPDIAHEDTGTSSESPYSTGRPDCSSRAF